MTTDIRIRKHTVRLVTTSKDYGSGMFRPGVRLFLTGPNGSIAGRGPKAWPLHMKIRRFRNRRRWLTYGWHRRYPGHMASWTNSLYIPVPHIKWHQSYRLRRFGMLRFDRWQYRFFTKVLGR